MSTYKGAPGTDNSVPQYVVVCPSMLSSSIRDPVMNAPPRRLEDVDLPFLLAGSFASARGYGQNFPGGGMMSSATHIAHEFIHWKDVYWLDQVDLVEDQTFSPAGWTKRITAYSARQSQELRRVKPELCKVNVGNYQWFMLEHYRSAKESGNLGYIPAWQDTPQDYPEAGFPANPPNYFLNQPPPRV